MRCLGGGLRLAISEPDQNPSSESQTLLYEAPGVREPCSESCPGAPGFDASFQRRAASGTRVAAPCAGKSTSFGVRDMGSRFLYTPQKLTPSSRGPDA